MHQESGGPDRRVRQRHRRRPPSDRRPRALPLTEEGFPAAVPDAPPPSPTVLVSDSARARYPWLPRRVIAGSVWRGPQHERVRVDQNGEASHWRCVPVARS